MRTIFREDYCKCAIVRDCTLCLFQRIVGLRRQAIDILIPPLRAVMNCNHSLPLLHVPASFGPANSMPQCHILEGVLKFFRAARITFRRKTVPLPISRPAPLGRTEQGVNGRQGQVVSVLRLSDATCSRQSTNNE